MDLIKPRNSAVAWAPYVATMCTMKNTVVRARIDAESKAQASEVLKANSLEMSDAIRIFLRRWCATAGCPSTFATLQFELCHASDYG